MMTRKTYYFILIISFSLISAFFLLDILVLNSIGVNNNYIYTARSLIIIFILFFETENSSNIFRLINRIAIPIMFVGLMFKVMHWPFSLPLFLVPAVTILATLLVNNMKNTSEKVPIFLILSIPLIHLVVMCMKIFHYPGAGLVWLMELIMTFVVVIALFLRISKMEK